MAEPTTMAAAGLLGKLVGEIGKVIKNPLLKKVEEWGTPAKIKEAGKKLAHYELVKTLVNPEKPQKISEFYLSPHFMYRNGKRFSVERIDDFGAEGYPLIEGIAGQGKSIFMRHLFLAELQAAERLPLLIELRKIDANKGLRQQIVMQIASLGLPSSDHVWGFLASTGRAVLLLDGFDEVADVLRANLLAEVNDIVVTYPELKVAMTSRPEASARGVSFFRSVSICTLQDGEKEKIIRKICNQNTANSLLAGLIKNQSLYQMVDTPLFITLLCVAYRAEQYIPETTHEFYDLVFNTLLYRHDAFKPGFNRARKSALGNHQFCLVFEDFCFYSLRQQVVRMSEEMACTTIAKALKNHQLSSNLVDHYFNDLVKITCLLVADGNEYQFLHKSIQDYFCAKFIKRLSDKDAEHFYSFLLSKGMLIQKYTQVLKFLKGIDEYRYTKFFEIPSVLYLYTGDFLSNPLKIKAKISPDRVLELMGGSDSAIAFDKDYEIQLYRQGRFDSQSLQSQLIEYFDASHFYFSVLDEFFLQKNVREKLESVDLSDYSTRSIAIDGSDDINVEINSAFLIKKINLKRAFNAFLKDSEAVVRLQASVIKSLELIRAKEAFSSEENSY